MTQDDRNNNSTRLKAVICSLLMTMGGHFRKSEGRS